MGVIIPPFGDFTRKNISYRENFGVARLGHLDQAEIKLSYSSPHAQEACRTLLYKA